MDNTNQNSNNPDKLRVITAEEVLAELRRRQKEYGSIYLPSDSYQRVRKTDYKNQNSKTSSKQTTSTSRNNLKKTFLFLEQFAFKKPLQSIFAVLMLLGITSGVYLSTLPAGSFDDRSLAIVNQTPQIYIKTSPNSIQLQPNITCQVEKIYNPSDCKINGIVTKYIKKLVVLSKPSFLDLKFDQLNQKVNVQKLREVRTDEINKAFPIKLLAIGEEENLNSANTYTNSPRLLFLSFTPTDNTIDPVLPTPVATVRNPLNVNDSGVCEVIDASKAKGNWKTYSTEASCIGGNNNPTITTNSNLNVLYNLACKNNSTAAQIVSFNVSATDSDGDLTYFTIPSNVTNNARLSDSLINYVERVVGDVENNSKKWDSYSFSNTVKLDLTYADVGKTITLPIQAYNFTNGDQKITKNIQVKVLEKLTGTSTSISPTISYPIKSQTLKGNQEVSWSLTNGCDFVRYKVELWDKYCTTFKTKIKDETYANTVKEGVLFKNQFDTRTVNDGDYCVRVFVRNTTQEAWRVANSGSFKVQNSSNRSPEVISKPSNTSLTLDETFNYEIKVEDADNDVTTIEVDKKPSWLSLNGNTLSGKASEKGSFEVSLRAKDSKGAYSNYQMFTINYSDTTNTPTEFAFTDLADNTIVKGSYTFKWSLTDKDQLKSLSIYISKAQAEWVKLADLKSNDKEYIFDSTKYENGEYRIKIVSIDKKNQTTENVSGVFVINQTGSENIENFVTVTTIEPDKNSKIREKRPLIKVSYTLPKDVTLDTKEYKVNINEVDLTSKCKMENNTIVCTLEEDLPKGTNKVEVTFKDSLSRTQKENWSFDIEEETSSTTSQISDGNYTVDYIIIGDRKIPRAVGILVFTLVIVALLIFLIPILIFKLVGKRKKEFEEISDTPKSPSGISESKAYSIPVEKINSDDFASESSGTNTSFQSNSNYDNVGKIDNTESDKV